MDFAALKPLKPLIENKKIKNISVNSTTQYYRIKTHKGLPSNGQKQIINFLEKKYTLEKKQEMRNPICIKNKDPWFFQQIYFKVKK